MLTLLLLASAASLAAAGRLAPASPDVSMRAAIALPFVLLALPIAAARITPAMRRAARASGAGSLAMLRHVLLPLCGPFVLPAWLLAAAFIAAPLLPQPVPDAASWLPFVLLVIAICAGLLRRIAGHPAT